MNTIKTLAFLATLTITFNLTLHAQGDDNLFPEGAFEMRLADGMPEGWGIPDKNDRPWKAGNIVTLEEEEGGTFARLTTTPEYPGFYALSAAIPIPEGKSSVRVSARMRATMEIVPGDWNGFKFHVGFANSAGPDSGAKGFEIINDKAAFSLQETTPDWTELESTIEVPTGATYVCLKVLVGSMVGTFDIDDVKVYAE